MNSDILNSRGEPIIGATTDDAQNPIDTDRDDIKDPMKEEEIANDIVHQDDPEALKKSETDDPEYEPS